MRNVDSEVGLRLKIARKAAGYKTALNFAHKMKIPKSTYSQHENGKRSLTAEQITHYADRLDIEASWLLTGSGHPCPLGKNKIQRKEIIEAEIGKLQKANHLPPIKNPHIEMNDNSAVVNMELFSKIITSAIKALTSENSLIQADELVAFCIDAYNNIEFLATSPDEKNKIIDLSVSSMLRGSHIIVQKAINT
jgi:transcriptional regulator with XRE-family HTH domain